MSGESPVLLESLHALLEGRTRSVGSVVGGREEDGTGLAAGFGVGEEWAVADGRTIVAAVFADVAIAACVTVRRGLAGGKMGAARVGVAMRMVVVVASQDGASRHR